MNVPTPDNLTPATLAARALRSDRAPASKAEFDAAIQRSGDDRGERTARSDSSRSDALRDSVEQLVSVAFVEPLMKMARNSPFKSQYFHGGFGEDAFAGQLDQRIAGNVTAGMGKSLIDSIYNRLSPHAGLEIDHHG